MQGHASGLDDGQTKIRGSFPAMAGLGARCPSWDLKHPSLSREIKRMDAA